MGLKELGEAIKASQTKTEVAFCGFDLWLEVFSSGRVKQGYFKKGGVRATPEEIEDTAKFTFPMPVVGKGIVISFDPTLPPDGFRLVP